MKPDKAIEILEDCYLDRQSLHKPDSKNALKLSIEALKDKQAERVILAGLSKQLLPGEDPE